MAGPVACLDSLRSLNSRTPLLSGSRECVQATQAGDAEHPRRISLGRHLSTRLIGSIKADPMTVLQPHEIGSCALISVQDGQRRVRHLLAASRGCPPRTHAAAPSGCIGRLWVPQDYSSRGRALERRRYTCADVARVKWLLVQGRRQVVGLSVVSACSRECSTVCDSHGCSWVGHGAGGLSGAPQQPPWLTPIQFGTSIPRPWNPNFNRSYLGRTGTSGAHPGRFGGVLGVYLKVVKRVLHRSLTGGRAEMRENSGTQLISNRNDACVQHERLRFSGRAAERSGRARRAEQDHPAARQLNRKR